MLMNRSRNLTGPLEQVTVSYRAAPQQPVRRVPAAERADQLATCLSLALGEPFFLRELQDAATELRDAPHLAAVLPRMVRTAMALLDADFGNIQVVDPRDGSLVLVTQCGFSSEFLDHFAVVHDDRSVCGRAARQGVQTVVADVRADRDFAPHDKVFRAAGVRAVQSTPLVDRAGRLVGMLSTHTSEPGLPNDHGLRIMQLYGLLAGESLGRHLRGPSADGDPAGLRPSAAASSGPGPDRAPIDPLLSRVMSDAINRIFSTGLTFAGALPRITDELAAQRVQAAVEELDEVIRSIQRAVLGIGADGAARPSGTPTTAEQYSHPSVRADASPRAADAPASPPTADATAPPPPRAP